MQDSCTNCQKSLKKSSTKVWNAKKFKDMQTLHEVQTSHVHELHDDQSNCCNVDKFWTGHWGPNLEKGVDTGQLLIVP